jgi:hypothetical protein
VGTALLPIFILALVRDLQPGRLHGCSETGTLLDEVLHLAPLDDTVAVLVELDEAALELCLGGLG